VELMWKKFVVAVAIIPFAIYVYTTFHKEFEGDDGCNNKLQNVDIEGLFWSKKAGIPEGTNSQVPISIFESSFRRFIQQKLSCGYSR